MIKKQGYAIYVHIPFCVRKCRYCDFLSVPWDAGKAEAYSKDLLAEIRQADWSRVDAIESVFIGGGTPSLMQPSVIGEILNALRSQAPFLGGCEITMEANPGTVDLDQLKALRRFGINRISLGAQSFQPEILKQLGRIHDDLTIEKTARDVVAAGFRNWNLDLMFDLPGQGMEEVEASMRRAIALEPTHLSFYSLIVEPGTPFYKEWEEGRLPMATEEGNRALYHYGRSLMEAAGYRQYEISNFAKPGMACHQNLAYWRRRPYLGFGLGAASMEMESRYVNPRDFQIYHDKVASGGVVREWEETMGKRDALAETMILGLRLTHGISMAELIREFGVEVDLIRPLIIEQQRQGLLIPSEERIALTKAGMDLANQVMINFL